MSHMDHSRDTAQDCAAPTRAGSQETRNDSQATGESSRARLLHRWYVRLPLKWLIFGAVTFFVLFPSPGQFARHLAHLRDMQALVEADAPRLASLEADLNRRLGPAPREPETVQREIERLVLEKVAYCWDWDQWGSADYLPTVDEMFARADQRGGRLQEDCDGRAVMAASLMRRMGFDARIATDLRHVWVKTPQGEWMGPGRSETLVTTDEGSEIAWHTLLANVPASLSFGIAVFPLGRELVILAAAFGLMLHRGMSRWAAATGLVLLLWALVLMRLGCLAPQATQDGASWPAWIGLACALAGFCVLAVASRRARRR